jgi:class 3 adenylate cyclase
LPHFIQENYRNGILQGSLQACTMFVDLSGFTRLTESLMAKGPNGAEELSDVLNHIFQPTVALVYQQGGFIPYFAGDSFTAIFPNTAAGIAGTGLAGALTSTQIILSRFSREQKSSDTILSEHNIGIKIGLSEGLVEWGIVGQHRKGYYFQGDPIDSCAQAQTRANSLEAVIDTQFLRLLNPSLYEAKDLGEGYFNLKVDLEQTAPSNQDKAVKLPNPDEFVTINFLPKEVYINQQIGEFRNVVSVFISFDGVRSHESLDHFASIVLDQSENFGGYFKEIDFGDKGGVMLCLFGAPVAFENNTERALEFVAAVRDDLSQLSELTGARYRVGMASGQAFTGVIGSTERCQYAAVGARVNLGARLMMQAEWGEVLSDENVSRNRNFKFSYRGDGHFKGFKDKLPTYVLTGRNLAGKASFAGDCFGRAGDLERLFDFAQPLQKNHFCGVAYIFGEAGIGKSRLSYELRRRLRDTMAVSWFGCASDQILRKQFNPFIYFLKNYFDQSPENTPERNKELFEQNFLELQFELTESKHSEADAVRREIARSQSVLAAMVGIIIPGALWEQLDARGRYQNALAAMANLFVAESLLQPVVIELEDGHWYDDMSREFLAQFARRSQAYPL